MFCDLVGEKEHTRFRKKRAEKFSSRLKVCYVLVGMKGYLKTYNHVKQFLHNELKAVFE